MNMPDMPTLPQLPWLVAITGLLLAGLALYLLWRGMRAAQRRIADLETRLASVQGDVQALTMAAAGMDKRLLNSDVRWRDAQARIQKLEGQQTSNRLYREAIELVRKGGDPDRLISELQLTQGEAELISMLHGGEKALP